jgi:hypothetical protein
MLAAKTQEQKANSHSSAASTPLPTHLAAVAGLQLCSKAQFFPAL